MAISLDARRHNAHKNLGVSLSGQGRYSEAAWRFLRAAELCPRDPRAAEHLFELLASHPEVLKERDLEQAVLARQAVCSGSVGGLS